MGTLFILSGSSQECHDLRSTVVVTQNLPYTLVLVLVASAQDWLWIS